MISQAVEYALRAMSHLASRNGVAANCLVTFSISIMESPPEFAPHWSGVMDFE